MFVTGSYSEQVCQMSALGSVFLGDFQRQRILSSTPPSSPPPSVSPSTMSHFPDSDILGPAPSKRDQPPPSHISPTLSLDLRIRWLETLLFGAKQDNKARKLEASASSLLRGIEELRHRVDTIVQGNEGLRRFMDHCKDTTTELGTPILTFRQTSSMPIS